MGHTDGPMIARVYGRWSHQQMGVRAAELKGYGVRELPITPRPNLVSPIQTELFLFILRGRFLFSLLAV